MTVTSRRQGLSGRVSPPPSRGRGGASCGGFTLLEMITVCFLLAMLLSAIFATFRVAMRSMEIAEERSQLYQTGRLLTAQIQRELYSLWVDAPAPADAGATETTSSAAGFSTGMATESEATPTLKGSVDTATNSAQLEMLITPPPYLDDDGLPQVGVVHVSYYIDEDPSTEEEGLVRAENRYIDLGDADQTTEVTPLCEEVTGFDVQYYSADDEAWVDEWDSTELPTAVTYSLTIDDPDDDEDAISLSQTVTLPRKLGAQIGEEVSADTEVDSGEMLMGTGGGQ